MYFIHWYIQLYQNYSKYPQEDNENKTGYMYTYHTVHPITNSTQYYHVVPNMQYNTYYIGKVSMYIAVI